MKDLEKEYSDIIIDGRINGFTFKHYKQLKSLKERLVLFELASGKEMYEMNSKIMYVVDRLYREGVLNLLSDVNMKYIIENSTLLPLVSANNTGEITMYRDNSYMFWCQFSKESKPLLGVTDYVNLMHCYGCGTDGNALDYLRKYENLTFKQTIQLISQIYLYDIKSYNPKFKSLVKKYQDAIIGDTYKELLEQGRKRMERRGFESKEFIKQYYFKKYELIDRISKGEYDPNFKYVEPVKRIFLKID